MRTVHHTRMCFITSCSWPDPPDDLTTEILVDGDITRHALAERTELLLVVRCMQVALGGHIVRKVRRATPRVRQVGLRAVRQERVEEHEIARADEHRLPRADGLLDGGIEDAVAVGVDPRPMLPRPRRDLKRAVVLSRLINRDAHRDVPLGKLLSRVGRRVLVRQKAATALSHAKGLFIVTTCGLRQCHGFNWYEVGNSPAPCS